MSDGKITFLTKIDNSNVEKELNDTKKKIRKSEEDIAKAENAKLPLTKQAEELGAALDSAKFKMEKLKAEAASVSADMQPGSTPDQYIAAYTRKGEIDAATKIQAKEVATLQRKWDSVNNKIDKYDLKIKGANASLAANTAKAGNLEAEMSRGGLNLNAAMVAAGKAATTFKRRFSEIARQALLFSFVARAFMAFTRQMSKVLNMNAEYRAELARLKGALLTAFQPIYEFILPGLLAIMRVLTAVVSVVANVFSILSGKGLKSTADSAEAMNKEAVAIEGVGAAAKEAKKELAGFDEINQLGEQDPISGGGGGGINTPGSIDPNFDEFRTDEYKEKIDELTVYLSGALLALGAILAFSGANIPLGIGLMAVGAIGLASQIKENWNKMNSKVGRALTKVLVTLGGAALVIGAILTFSGANLPLGIGLMVAGATVLGSAVYLNWEELKKKIRENSDKITAVVSTALLALGAILAFSGVNLPLGLGLMVAGAAGLVSIAHINWSSLRESLSGELGAIMAISSAAMLALGVILALSGVALPLGIALIAAGAVGLVTVTALNWNYIVEQVQDVWDRVRSWWDRDVAPVFTVQWWKEKFSSIAEGLRIKCKDGINSAIGLFNRFIDWVNRKMHFQWDGFNLMGHQVISPGSFQLFTIPSIPYLAKGAVLPANKPFLSVVGDQKNGTNVEAPLATIQEALLNALAEYGGMGRQDISINFTGDLAQLARVLKPVIDMENKRIGPSLARG